MENIAAVIFILICTIYDIKTKQIPVFMIIIFGSLSVLLLFISYPVEWYPVLYALVPGAAMLAIGLCTKESIGYGDGFAVLVLGLLLGLAKCVVAVFTGFVLSAVFAMLLLLLRKANGKSRLPYMPFLAAGLGVSLLG